MSKLYKKYVLLKVNNSNKIYLFECGIFYVFIHEDARIMANFLNLKLTPLNSIIMKCGFPVKSADKYLNILKNSEYDIEIVPSDTTCSPTNINSYTTYQNTYNIINNFLSVNISELSISQAFDLLIDLQDKFKRLQLEKDKYETKK